MSGTIVVNVRNPKHGFGLLAEDVYIGRPSVWGNPFKVGVHGDREQVVSKYREWLAGRPALMAKVRRELSGKRLGCFCYPQLCHGDVLVAVCDGAPID